jgi:hypothetical protein
MNVLMIAIGFVVLAIGVLVSGGAMATERVNGPAFAGGLLIIGVGACLLFGGVIEQIGKVADKSLEGRNRWLAQWRLLRAGMTESDVRSLIGSPDEVEALVAMTGDMACRWRYGSFFSKGTIVFHQGKIVSFTVPSM